jgi:xylulose-5-phosphate/fructose-6-phosphate phosphoketolase
LPQLGSRAAYAKQAIGERLCAHKQYIQEHGDDMPEIAGWQWGRRETPQQRASSTEGDNV